MTKHNESKAVLWERLLASIEALESSDEPEKELTGHLTAISEGFGSFDPVDAYQEYLLVRFCRTLQSAVSERQI